MRPLNLKLKGFTSFRDEQEIDFTDLDLFVLWGPVGAGKSSILDAMTYALFGHVERVGNEVRQLVSHAQPRLVVTMTFSVDGKTYRVTRQTSAKGQSKALLERQEGDDWESFGEGADQVREVNRLISKELIGLDYAAFTRAVVLPQGKFAQFLTGDAAKRREILTELLGLELFKRMSQRANEIAKNARVHLENKTELLDREYAGIDSGAVAVSKARAEELKEMLVAAQDLEKSLAGIEKRWTATEAAHKALTGCVTEVRDASDSFADAARSLDQNAKGVAEAEAALAAARKGVQDAERAAQAAAKKRSTAEGKSGSLEELVRLRARAESLDEARAEHEAALASAKEAEAAAKEATAVAKETAVVLAAAKKERDAAIRALEKAEQAHAAAHEQEAIGSLVADLKRGDPCPICERPLEKLPKVTRKKIETAKKALDSARGADKAAATALAEAETRAAVATQEMTASERDAKRCEKEVTNKKGRLDVISSELSAVIGRATDPITQLDKLIAELRGLVEAEEKTAKAEADARRELGRVELATSKVTGEIARIKARITGIPLGAMCARVGSAAPDVDVGDISLDELPDAADALATVAATTGKELERLAQELDGLLIANEVEKGNLLDEARTLLPEGMPLDAVGITGAVSQARSAASQLKADTALAEKAAIDLATKLATKTRYEEEIALHRAEQATYSALGKELKSDRIVQFLQAEALAVLAQAASAHLQKLSGDRYLLDYEDDNFHVVDAWNGHEKRNVATLSGGETFQASLALALALSEQAQYLAVAERGRLDSLFLDEGFDTQDIENLDVVVDALDRIGGEDRLVGVITHVRALADQFPIRIEVAKAQRGSTLTRSTAELTT